MLYSRRDFGRFALTGLPVAGLLCRSERASADVLFAKPDSKWAGVQVGLNVPFNFGNNYMSADETLARCLQLGISAIELRSQPVEAFMGSPAAAPPPRGDGAPGGSRSGGRGGRAPLTPEQEAVQKAAAEELRKWRASAPMSKVKEFRQKYADAGVDIQILKFDSAVIYNQPDEVLDYCFELAERLGARAVSCEISPPQTARVGQFADKHKIMVGYHGHNLTTPAIWEAAFGQATHNGANLDLGHFVAGNNTSPVAFLEQYHDRITHVHVKDMKMHDGPAVPFGQGDTPIKEVLQRIRDRKWKMQATVEFEYPIPEGSDRMTEIAKCLEYCRQCLLG
jgi:sugar phosphate isomerase/epimerase